MSEQQTEGQAYIDSSFLEPKSVVRRAMLILMPPQHEQYLRPYMSGNSAEGLDLVLEATNGGANLSSAVFSNIASKVLTPTWEPRAELKIPNTMRNLRYAFYIEIETMSVYGREVEIIKGFTNYDGVSQGGHLDPNMWFYINHRQLVSLEKFNSPRIEPATMRHDNMVLSNIGGIDNGVVMRPEDIIYHQQYNPMQTVGYGKVIEVRTKLDGVAKYAQHTHHMPAEYLSNILNAYVTAVDPNKASTQDELKRQSVDYYSDAYATLKTSNLDRSNFYLTMSNGSALQSHCFNLDQFSKAFNVDDSIWEIIQPSKKLQYSLIDHTSTWKSASVETNVAFSLTHMVPALMAKVLIDSLHFSINNLNFTGEPDIGIWSFMRHATNKAVNEIQLADYIKGRINIDLVRGLLMQKAYTYNITVKCDTMTNINIEMSLDGNPKEIYNSPLFCSSKYSPMIGTDEHDLQLLSSSIDTLAENIINQRYGYHTPMPNERFDAPEWSGFEAGHLDSLYPRNDELVCEQPFSFIQQHPKPRALMDELSSYRPL